jgi:hypothetical protein
VRPRSRKMESEATNFGRVDGRERVTGCTARNQCGKGIDQRSVKGMERPIRLEGGAEFVGGEAGLA